MKNDRPNTAKSCSIIQDDEIDPDRRIVIVPESSAENLTDKEYVDYWNYRKQLLSYLLKFGKDETKADGYSPYTVYADNYRQTRFDRWVWDRHDGYIMPPDCLYVRAPSVGFSRSLRLNEWYGMSPG